MFESIYLKNSLLAVEIETKGAQIKSIKGKNGTDFLWQGDENVWKDRAPVLFPICGTLKDNKYIFKNKEYTLYQHGYAKDKEFSVEKSDTTSVTFLHKSDEETKKVFPFSYEFRVTYELKENELLVTYSTKNLSEETMYFSVGAHEGYSCPEGIEDYTVVFDKKETLKSYIVNGPLLENKTEDITQNSNELPLKYDYFKVDALVFKYINSRKLSLINKNNSKKITVDFEGFDFLLIWTVPGAKFICFEPWCGSPDGVDSDYDITKKEGIIKLSPSKIHSVTHKIKFEE